MPSGMLPSRMNLLEKSTPPKIQPTSGMMRSAVSDPVIVAKAPPMMTPTARSMTLPLAINSLNSPNILLLPEWLVPSTEPAARIAQRQASSYVLYCCGKTPPEGACYHVLSFCPLVDRAGCGDVAVRLRHQQRSDQGRSRQGEVGECRGGLSAPRRPDPQSRRNRQGCIENRTIDARRRDPGARLGNAGQAVDRR